MNTTTTLDTLIRQCEQEHRQTKGYVMTEWECDALIRDLRRRRALVGQRKITDEMLVAWKRQRGPNGRNAMNDPRIAAAFVASCRAHVPQDLLS